jgi:hypothetical protein
MKKGELVILHRSGALVYTIYVIEKLTDRGFFGWIAYRSDGTIVTRNDNINEKPFFIPSNVIPCRLATSNDMTTAQLRDAIVRFPGLLDGSSQPLLRWQERWDGQQWVVDDPDVRRRLRAAGIR